MRVGIAGLGYWGVNLLRNFRALETCHVAAIADYDPARLTAAARLAPEAHAVAEAVDLIEDPDLDALVLALPASQLADCAVAALQRGKHVLLEKPMACSLEEGERIAEEAEEAKDTDALVCMVDYTFVHSPAVRQIAESLPYLGLRNYYGSSRANFTKPRADVDVVWDLVSHDVAILAYLLGHDPASVVAVGDRSGRVAEVVLIYADGFRAFLHASWLAPTKIRRVLLSCEKGMAVWDDTDTHEPLRIYEVDRGFEPGEDSSAPTVRLGDVLAPRLEAVEPLRAVASRFVSACRGEADVVTDWAFGMRVLRVLEAARSSLHYGGTVPVAEIGRRAFA